ncbi:MAG TPA: hypothetical protein VHV99_09995 [Paraburkholderia sp.]|jgi:hypothetical protein|nr:hypothetical protein [Paraburkholderia sp.]
MRKQIIRIAQATTSRKHQQAKPEKTKKIKTPKTLTNTGAQQKTSIRLSRETTTSPQHQ